MIKLLIIKAVILWYAIKSCKILVIDELSMLQGNTGVKSDAQLLWQVSRCYWIPHKSLKSCLLGRCILSENDLRAEISYGLIGIYKRNTLYFRILSKREPV